MGSQPSWPPNRAPNDCSIPLCSISCPEWCNYVDPPIPLWSPPPPQFSHIVGNPISGRPLSHLGILLVAFTTGIFILIAYSVLYRHCLREYHLGTALATHTPTTVPNNATPTSTGLDDTLINKISTQIYQRGDYLVGGTNCSVCLSEFREGERLRVLPNCSHVFHLQCIDMWLRSHANCPLCRVCILWASLPPSTSPESEVNQDDIVETTLLVQIQDSGSSFVGSSAEGGQEGRVWPAAGSGVVDGIQAMKRSFSMDHVYHWREISEVLVGDAGLSSSRRNGEGSSSRMMGRSISMNTGRGEGMNCL